MQKKAGKFLGEEGSDCIFEAGLPGANPSNRRPTDAGESVLIPQNCQPPEEPMSCIHGRLDSAYDSDRDPGVEPCYLPRNATRLAGSRERISPEQNILPTASIRLKENRCLTSNFG